jgi:transcription initiation factor TFIID TATA-box-binding protein
MPQSTQDLLAELKYIQQTFSCASQIAQVHNLVGTCVLRSDNFKLDLHTISRLLPNTVFEKQKFAAITMRIGQPTCTVLLFTSGKMVLTGCKSYIDCVIASLHILYLMRSNFPGVIFNIAEVKIQNIVGNADIQLQANERINLERFYSDFNVFCTYQPNMFPGLIYRPTHLNIVLLIFFSGKIVITGAKSMCDVFTGWEQVHDCICCYKERITSCVAAVEQ